MERTTIDLWFGAFVTAGFVALLVLALKVGNLGAERATNVYRVEARFDNIGGLKVRGPVRSAGVLVGRVDNIHFDNDRFQAQVTLALDSRYKFPKDTSASILTSGLLGETYVGLEAGGEEKKLEAGDRITITQSAVVLEKLIGQFLFSKAQETPAPAAAAAPAPAPAAAAAPKK
ncbi:MAG TPA: outer membrane lipid asymmetry maintenance protein MlaD [Usitatibacter sp.]|jgi:phospholipid/cholesterol/gamma-HCH transport system substrate-binding protein|nr:outer membrane lipid asymmetry maintenance protein MlaD [Usitatibacter sp.]